MCIRRIERVKPDDRIDIIFDFQRESFVVAVEYRSPIETTFFLAETDSMVRAGGRGIDGEDEYGVGGICDRATCIGDLALLHDSQDPVLNPRMCPVEVLEENDPARSATKRCHEHVFVFVTHIPRRRANKSAHCV